MGSKSQLQSSSGESPSLVSSSHVVEDDESSSEEFELMESTRETLDSSMEALGCYPMKCVGE